MLRIIHSPAHQVQTVSLEGKLLKPWIDEVRHITDAALHSGGLRLELTQLTFADEAGLALLRTLASNGVELVGCSPFLGGLMASSAARP